MWSFVALLIVDLQSQAVNHILAINHISGAVHYAFAMGILALFWFLSICVVVQGLHWRSAESSFAYGGLVAHMAAFTLTDGFDHVQQHHFESEGKELNATSCVVFFAAPSFSLLLFFLMSL